MYGFILTVVTAMKGAVESEFSQLDLRDIGSLNFNKAVFLLGYVHDILLSWTLYCVNWHFRFSSHFLLVVLLAIMRHFLSKLWKKRLDMMRYTECFSLCYLLIVSVNVTYWGFLKYIWSELGTITVTLFLPDVLVFSIFYDICVRSWIVDLI